MSDCCSAYAQAEMVLWRNFRQSVQKVVIVSTSCAANKEKKTSSDVKLVVKFCQNDWNPS